MPIRIAIAITVLACWLASAGSSAAAATPANRAPAGATDAVLGDADCGGQVQPLDAVPVLAYVAGAPMAGSCVDTRADVDCDHHLLPLDALRIIIYAATGASAPAQGCPAIGAAMTPGDLPSSGDLIDDAFEAGDINEPTAVMYKAFATYGDDRLPPEYRGALDPDEHYMDEVIAVFNELPLNIQEVVQPFLLPPTATNSWWQQRYGGGGSLPQPAGECTITCLDRQFVGKPTQNGKVIVWREEGHPEDQGTVEDIAAAIDSDIWAKETGLMGRETLADGNLSSDIRGLDGRLDIYVLGLYNRGETIPFIQPSQRFTPCVQSPAFIIIDRHAPEPVITATHEMFHALQFAFKPDFDNCQTLGWLAESTATWAQNYVFPNNNREYERDEYFLLPSAHLYSKENAEAYGAYIFWLYVTHKYGNDIVRQIYTSLESDLFRLAIDPLLEGGFKERFPEFALYNWNQPAVDFYNQWDGVLHSAATRAITATDISKPDPGFTEVSLNGGESADFSAQFSQLRDLTAQYYHFKITDPDVRLVQINEPFDQPSEWFKMQVLTSEDGENWTLAGEGGRTICRSLEDQNVTDIVVIVTNSHWDLGTPLLLPEFEQPLLTASDACGYTGTVHGHGLYSLVIPPSSGLTMDIEATDLVFVRGDPPPPGQFFGQEWEALYKIVSGTITYTWDGTTNGGNGFLNHPIQACVVHETLTISVDGSETGGIAVRQGANGLEYAAYVGRGIYYLGTKHCPISGDLNMELVRSSWWQTDPTETTADADRLEGSAVIGASVEFEGYHFEWELTRDDPP